MDGPAPKPLPDRARQPLYLEPFAVADFKLQLQKPYWTDHEAATIFAGKNPAFVVPAEIEHNRLQDDVAFEICRIRDLIRRAQELGDLPERIRPIQAVKWAFKVHLAIPEELLEAARAYETPLLTHDSAADEIAQLRSQLASLEKKARQKLGELIEERNQLRSKVRELNSELPGLADKASQQAQPTANSTDDEPKKRRTSDWTRRDRTNCLIIRCLLEKHYDATEATRATPPKKALSDIAGMGCPIDMVTLTDRWLEGAAERSRRRNR